MSVRWRQAAAVFALSLGLLAAASALRAQAAAPDPVPAAVSADGGGFTPAQRAAIVDVVRGALKSDPSILRDAIAALQADEARAQDVAARQAIGRLGPSIARTPGDPVVGNPEGDVTLVEFYDVRCPYCRSMLPVVASLLAADPKLRLVYKDIPILGPASVLGARAVLAAQAQGGYARMRDAVMKGPTTITDDTLHTAATASGLDWTRLRADMEAPAVQARIDANLALAHDLGIQGTPVYVVGTKMLPGAVGLRELQDAVAGARG